MNNILNKKREREKDEKGITITLGKLNKGYYYISDTFNENIKIKIPIEGGISNEENNNYLNNKNPKDETNSQQENFLLQNIVPEEIPQIAKQSNANYTGQIYIPACSSWFNFDSINEIEMRSLPEFFCNKYPSKTPETYKEYRNFIINLYRENQKGYLTATTCRRHLAGDACAILRIHAFLEHWGLINFNVDPLNKPTNPFLPKAFNFKSPVYIDASTLLVNEGNDKSTKVGNNNVILTNKSGDELFTLYPINNHPENLFRSFFTENSVVLNKINFLTKNYRPKCDLCSGLCELEFYVANTKLLDYQGDSKIPSILNPNKQSIMLVCEKCFEKNEFPNGLTKEDFTLSNVFNILVPNEKFHINLKERLETEKWTEEETKMLLDEIDQYNSENVDWDKIAKVFGGKKTKTDCIVHLMQLPIKENVSFKVTDLKQGNTEMKKVKDEVSAVTDQTNPLIGQVVFFAKMFEKYVEDDVEKEEAKKNKEKDVLMNDATSQGNPALNEAEGSERVEHNQEGTQQQNENEEPDLSKTDTMKNIIYKTYAKSIDVSKKLMTKEKKEMKKIMDLLCYLQMKKIELKLNYFAEFEKMIQAESQQLKTMESQIIQDRIKLAIKKNELLQVVQKIKEGQKAMSNSNLSSSSGVPSQLRNISVPESQRETKVMNLSSQLNPPYRVPSSLTHP